MNTNTSVDNIAQDIVCGKKLAGVTSNKYHVFLASILNSWLKPFTPTSDLNAFLNQSSQIPLDTWIASIQQISKIDDINLLCAIFYLKKIIISRKDLPFSKLNVHRLFLVSVIVASKFLDDITYKNKDWQKIGGKWFSINEINTMEIEFLVTMDFRLRITSHDLVELIMEYTKLVPSGCSFGSLVNMLYSQDQEEKKVLGKDDESINTLKEKDELVVQKCASTSCTAQITLDPTIIPSNSNLPPASFSL